MLWRRLLHMGAPVVDLTYRIDRLPEPGGESLASEAAVTPGGGFNMMAAARAAGLSVACGGRVGSGPNGEMLLAALAAAGIPLIAPRARWADSGSCVVLVTPDGERSFVSHPGAEGRIESPDLADLRPAAGDVVFVSGYTLAYPGAAPALAGWVAALSAAVPLAFDPGPLVGRIAPDRLSAVLARIEWLGCSAAEATAMTGAAVPEEAAEALRARGCRNIAVRDGARGCLIVPRGGPARRVPGFRVPVVDTNGAGDTHFGAFLAELGRGASPEAAARYANAAAALSVMRQGGAAAPADADIRAFASSGAG